MNVYNVLGVLVHSVVVEAMDYEVQLPKGEIYLIQIGKKTVKLKL